MALNLKSDLCFSGCNQLQVFDKTGVYHAITNIGGYGNPNIDISDVQAAFIYLIPPNGIQYTFDVFGTLPNITDTPYQINPVDIGGGTMLPDGLYQLTYEIHGNFDDQYFNIQVSRTEINTCNVECCIKQALSSIRGCKCKDKKEEEVVRYWNSLESLKAAVKCGKTEQAVAILSEIQSFCDRRNCNCC